MDINTMLRGVDCGCGKHHACEIEQVYIEKNAIARMKEICEAYRKILLVADENTFAAAGAQTEAALADKDLRRVVFPGTELLVPNEAAIGAVTEALADAELIVGIGSGVIQDLCKYVSHFEKVPYVIVATAPSMDGYASNGAAMITGGMKVTYPAGLPKAIVADPEILRLAPMEMLRAGIGDMLAKYVSIAEWRIARLLCGEYYCEAVAELVRTALKKCTDNAAGLLRREDAAVEAVFEGLVIGGVAMTYAGLSRPASGVEHYFSHVQDMRGLEFGTPTQLHGIQCARATAAAIRLYEQLSKMKPDGEKALAYVQSYDPEAWNRELKAFLGKGADTMIAQEKREGKYDVQKHARRLPLILENWDAILQILREELPTAEEFEKLMAVLGIPAELDADAETAGLMFKATKDIRDKYVLSRLAWDLGVLEELAQTL